MITLRREDAEPFTGFQHAGMEFIYMLTGEVVYRHGDNVYRLRPGDSILFDSGALHGPETLVKLPMTYLSIYFLLTKQGFGELCVRRPRRRDPYRCVFLHRPAPAVAVFGASACPTAYFLDQENNILTS